MCALVVGNAVVALAAEDAVTFSRPRGFYVDAFELELEGERPDATVLYSLDGSTPSRISLDELGDCALTWVR